MLDYGKLVEVHTSQIFARSFDFRRELREYVAVEFRMRGPQIFLPAFANINDVYLVTQVQRINRDRMPGRVVDDIDMFTSTVALVDQQIVFGHELVRYRNLAMRPSYQKVPMRYTAAESPAFSEALDMDHSRRATGTAVRKGHFAQQQLLMPQVMVGYENAPTGNLRSVPLPPSATGLNVWLVPRGEAKPELGTPVGYFLDLRAWRGRELINELRLCMPMVPNPITAIAMELFPTVADPDLTKLPETQLEILWDAIQARCPDVPEKMLIRAMENVTAPVQTQPGYGISVEDAVAACRRHLSAYGSAASDTDILNALEQGNPLCQLSGAPRVQVFRWTGYADRFISGSQVFQFVWPTPAANDPVVKAVDGAEAMPISRRTQLEFRKHERVHMRKTRREQKHRQAQWEQSAPPAGAVQQPAQQPASSSQKSGKKKKKKRKNNPPQHVRAARRAQAASQQVSLSSEAIENAVFSGSTSDLLLPVPEFETVVIATDAPIAVPVGGGYELEPAVSPA